MPTLAFFDGIKIAMYAEDHAPPHFHVIYAGQEALVRISDLAVLHGDLPRPILRRALQWADDNQGLLALHWLRLNEE
ncbi:MAG TPA: DUF4160 domain-containing protein [Azospirillaceae bacterium]|nr:DUF4160 domain-containing protein [Azospirillaceae bacterium]